MRMIKMIVIGLLFILSSLVASQQKVVFDVTTGNADKIQKGVVQTINGLVSYYEENKIEYRIVVVISGKAYKYFVSDLKNSPYKGKLKVVRAQKKLASKLQKLHLKGVEFEMCQAGMKARGIDKTVLYDYVVSDKNKSIYLIEWQNRGYAYLPVH